MASAQTLARARQGTEEGIVFSAILAKTIAQLFGDSHEDADGEGRMDGSTGDGVGINRPWSPCSCRRMTANCSPCFTALPAAARHRHPAPAWV